MVKKAIENFNISQICDSGQCFRMMPVSEKSDRVPEEVRMKVIASDRYLEIHQIGKNCIFDCSEEEFEEFWKLYF